MHFGSLITFCLLYAFITISPAKSSNKGLSEILAPYFKTLYQSDTFHIRQSASDTIRHILSDSLALPSSLSYQPELEHLGKVSSSDGNLHIYTWNFMGENNRYTYGCIMQYLSDDQIHVIPLYDNTDNIPLDKSLDADEWYGCLYYAIVTKKRRRETTYTLLGWDGYDNIVARKVIDVLTFNAKNEPRLGKNVFKMEQGTQKRVLFQYSATGSMVLVYDDDYKRLIFDHLSPANPQLEGQYQYYGSDFSYDGFKYKRGKWVFEALIDPRRKD